MLGSSSRLLRIDNRVEQPICSSCVGDVFDNVAESVVGALEFDLTEEDSESGWITDRSLDSHVTE